MAVRAFRWSKPRLLGTAIICGAFLLAGCSGSKQETARSSTPTETVPIPVDIAPVPTSTTPASVATAPSDVESTVATTTAAPATSTPAAGSEEALRARALAYHQVFFETDRALPDVSLEPLRTFFKTQSVADEILAELIDAKETGGWTKVESPLVETIVVERIQLEPSGLRGRVLVCTIDNLGPVDGGPDRKPRTADDIVLFSGLQTIRTDESWVLADSEWTLDEVLNSVREPTGAKCAGS